MTTAEAEGILAPGQGRVCVTFFRRADGRVLTKDCGGGFFERFRARTRAARHRSLAFRVWVTITAVVIAGLLTGGERLRGALGLTSNQPGSEGDTQVESQRTRPVGRKMGEVFRRTDNSKY